VYLELLRRGYETAVGKLYQSEVDFVCTRTDEVCYYQVTESMHAGNVAERELDPLLKIKDNYPKYILTMDHPLASQQDGIQQLNLVSWLLGQSAH
jgi:predicted AAA+ superfamily ATPase